MTSKITRTAASDETETKVAIKTKAPKMSKEERAAKTDLEAELKAKKLAYTLEKKSIADAKAAKKAYDAAQPKEIKCAICDASIKSQKQMTSHIKFNHPEEWAKTHPVVKNEGNVQLVSVERPTVAQAMVDAGMTNIPSGIDIILSDPMVTVTPEVTVTVTKAPVEVNSEMSLDQLFRDIMAVEKQANDTVAKAMENWMKTVYSPVVADLKKYQTLLPGAEVVESNLKALAEGLGGEQVKFHAKVVTEIAKIKAGIEAIQAKKEALESTPEYKQAMKLRLHPVVGSAIGISSNVLSTPVVHGDLQKFLNDGYTYTYEGSKKGSKTGLVPYAQSILRDGKDKEVVATKVQNNKLPNVCAMCGVSFTDAEMAVIADAIVAEAMKKNDVVSAH